MTTESRQQEPRATKFAQLQQKDQAALGDEATSRRALNALSMTASIVNALVHNPGSVSNGDSLVLAARTMLASADETANRLLVELDLGNVNWGRFRIMRLATEAVSARWAASARTDGEPSADVSMFLPVWAALAKQNLPMMQYEDPAEDDRVALQIAILDAMQPVMQEIASFDMFRDPTKAAVHARSQILGAVDESLKELMPSPNSKRAVKLLQQALLRNAGTVYASSWRREANEVLDSLEPLSDTQQREEVGRRVDGWPIEPVDMGFKSAFAKLTEMVGYLAAPMKEPVSAISSEVEEHAMAAQSADAEQATMPNAPLTAEAREENGPREFVDIPEWLLEAPQWDDDGSLSPDDEMPNSETPGPLPVARSDN